MVQFEAERSGASMAGSKGMLFRETFGKGLVMCLDLGMVHACGSECLGIVVRGHIDFFRQKFESGLPWSCTQYLS